MSVFDEIRPTRFCESTVYATMTAAIHRYELIWFRHCCRSCCWWQSRPGTICSRTDSGSRAKDKDDEEMTFSSLKFRITTFQVNKNAAEPAVCRTIFDKRPIRIYSINRWAYAVYKHTPVARLDLQKKKENFLIGKVLKRDSTFESSKFKDLKTITYPKKSSRSNTRRCKFV